MLGLLVQLVSVHIGAGLSMGSGPMAPPLALPLAPKCNHRPPVPPSGSGLRYWLCPSLPNRPSLCTGGESLASSHSGEFSLFVVATAPKLTDSDESAMIFAAHDTIFKGLLTTFQQLWP
jgi:hypothetical protein